MTLRPMDSEFKRRMSPSLSLLVLAALTPPEHAVTIEDENTGKLNLDDRPDLVGITCNVDNSPRAYDIAAHYRHRGIPVVIGGTHASASPEEAGAHADAVCIGEAEDVWEFILADAAIGCLMKTYRGDGPPNPASTPPPRWNLIDRSKYLYSNVVCASRGCPFTCEFCYNSSKYVHKGWRPKSVDAVLREISLLGRKQVMFIDDNLIGDPNWTRELVRAIKPLGLTWHAAVSANIGMMPGLLDEMKGSGCESLFIGFETINAGSIADAGKRQNKTHHYERTISEIHDREIMVNASMVFGFDHDMPDVFDRTLDWLVENKVETMTGHILTPYPGTQLHGRMKAEGRIIETDPAKYNTSNVVFKPKNMSPDELLAGYLRIYDELYSWSNILRRMPTRPRQRVPFLLFNVGYRKYGKVASMLASGMGLMGRFGGLMSKLSYGVDNHVMQGSYRRASGTINSSYRKGEII